MLSPTVNTNDRDQAAYRARELGEGHSLDCFISEKQQQQIQEKSEGKPATLRAVLQVNFEQTKQEEGAEDLSAYRLHLQGQLTLAADKAKKKLQLDKPVSHMGSYARKEGSEQADVALHSQHKAQLFQIFEEFFISDTSNEAYLEQLKQEMYKGGSEPTQADLKRTVASQLAKITRLEARLNENKARLGPAYDIAWDELPAAKAALETEQNNITEKWDSMASLFPENVSATASTQGTCEVEAEQEAEQEQQIQSESLQESERHARASSTKELLSNLDEELLSTIWPEGQFDGYQTYAAYGRYFWQSA